MEERLEEMSNRQQADFLMLPGVDNVHKKGFALLESLYAISENMVSDCTINELSDIANAALNYDFGKILTVKGEDREGGIYTEYYPDEEALQQQIIELFYEEMPQEQP